MFFILTSLSIHPLFWTFLFVAGFYYFSIFWLRELAVSDLFYSIKKKTKKLTGRSPRFGLCFNNSSMTSRWPLWQALNKGVAPSYKRRKTKFYQIIKQKKKITKIKSLIKHTKHCLENRTPPLCCWHYHNIKETQWRDFPYI